MNEHFSLCCLSSRLKSGQTHLSAVNKEIGQLGDQLIPALIKESASLQVAKILRGDYDLKIARQDYFTSNQDRVRSASSLTRNLPIHKITLPVTRIRLEVHLSSLMCNLPMHKITLPVTRITSLLLHVIYQCTRLLLSFTCNLPMHKIILRVTRIRLEVHISSLTCNLPRCKKITLRVTRIRLEVQLSSFACNILMHKITLQVTRT